MKIFFLTLILLFSLNSCNENEESTPFSSVTVTPILIGKGNDISDLTQNNLKITNQTDWNSLLSSMNSVSNTFSETTIDFTNYDIIAVIDDERPCTNFSVNIDAIVENEETINVTLSYSGDTNNCFTAIVQPYHIVKIPKSTKPVIFQ